MVRFVIAGGEPAMGIFDILWLFFLIATVQPIIRQKMLEASRLRALARLERKRESRVIALIHRQETMQLLGFPLMRYIGVDDSEEVLRAIMLTEPAYPIDLPIHTPGGLVLAAGQIARALHRRRGKVTVFVPHHAMSGGTLIALAADEIVMAENAVLGPVDPQISQLPGASVLTVFERKEAKDIDDQTLIMADVSRKAIAQVRTLVQSLLAEDLAPKDAEVVADKLTAGTWTHDYAITVDEVRALGLPVSTDMPPEVYQFMHLFPQPTRAVPSVEYVPVPYRGRAREGRG
jgi:ClpP class serine protease